MALLQNEAPTNLDLRSQSPAAQSHYAVAEQIIAHQKELESGISLTTHERNEELQGKMELQKKIDKDIYEKQFKLTETKEVDCSKLLKKFNRDALYLNY